MHYLTPGRTVLFWILIFFACPPKVWGDCIYKAATLLWLHTTALPPSTYFHCLWKDELCWCLMEQWKVRLSSCGTLTMVKALLDLR